MSANVETSVLRALAIVRAELAEASAAKKCHACGCLHETVKALESIEPGRGELAPALAEARAVFRPRKYDCLGCEVCYPAIAANAFSEAFPEAGATLDLCPSEAPVARPGWPRYPGDYTVLDPDAPVAVATLADAALAKALAEAAPSGLAIVGTVMTENLGIERAIENVITNRAIRFLVLAGEDSRQKVGHLPGASFLALARSGVDAEGRIVGAPGKRPYLRNIERAALERFRETVEVVDSIGASDARAIAALVATLVARSPGRAGGFAHASGPAVLEGRLPARLVQDPAGYFVIQLDRREGCLVLEHYANDGRLNTMVRGRRGPELSTVALEEGLLTRLDHAAYLGRELARAEAALRSGEPFVQDEAPEAEVPCGGGSCGCVKAPVEDRS